MPYNSFNFVSAHQTITRPIVNVDWRFRFKEKRPFSFSKIITNKIFEPFFSKYFTISLSNFVFVAI